MNSPIIGSMLAMFAVALCVACSSSSGRPAQDSVAVPPDQIVNFSVLYAQNCAGCHGVEGSGGAAMSLANPTFLAIADDNVIRRIAANGIWRKQWRRAGQLSLNPRRRRRRNCRR